MSDLASFQDPVAGPFMEAVLYLGPLAKTNKLPEMILFLRTKDPEARDNFLRAITRLAQTDPLAAAFNLFHGISFTRGQEIEARKPIIEKFVETLDLVGADDVHPHHSRVIAAAVATMQCFQAHALQDNDAFDAIAPTIRKQLEHMLNTLDNVVLYADCTNNLAVLETQWGLRL